AAITPDVAVARVQHAACGDGHLTGAAMTDVGHLHVPGRSGARDLDRAGRAGLQSEIDHAAHDAAAVAYDHRAIIARVLADPIDRAALLAGAFTHQRPAVDVGVARIAVVGRQDGRAGVVVERPAPGDQGVELVVGVGVVEDEAAGPRAEAHLGRAKNPGRGRRIVGGGADVQDPA